MRLPNGGMKIPKMDESARLALQVALRGKSEVEFKPMFGNLAAFLQGNMFAGVFGKAVFLRLSEEDRAIAAGLGARPFEPMAGRPMKEYVEAPVGWIRHEKLLDEWLYRSLEYARSLPSKKGATRAKAKKGKK